MHKSWSWTWRLAATAFLSSTAVSAQDVKRPSVITTTSVSATFPAGQLTPGVQIWASWLVLPPGKSVDVPASKGDKWVHLDVALSGSATWSGAMPPECRPLRYRQPTVASVSSQVTLTPGDGFACNYYQRGASREENRGPEPYTHAVINIGGPWAFGMSSIDDGYSTIPENARVLGVESALFKTTESEILAKGAMTLSIRNVSMPPGTHLVVIDKYPTIRMVTEGQLSWGVLPPGSATPKVTFTKKKLGEIVWGVLAPGTQMELSNRSDGQTEYVEWLVFPVDKVMP